MPSYFAVRNNTSHTVSVRSVNTTSASQVVLESVIGTCNVRSSHRRRRRIEERHAGSAERLAGGARAAGVVVQFDGGRPGPVARHRLRHPLAEPGTARAAAAVQRGRLDGLTGDRPETKTVVAVARAATDRKGRVRRQTARVAVRRLQGRRRRNVEQAARRRRTSYQQHHHHSIIICIGSVYRLVVRIGRGVASTTIVKYKCKCKYKYKYQVLHLCV